MMRFNLNPPPFLSFFFSLSHIVFDVFTLYLITVISSKNIFLKPLGSEDPIWFSLNFVDTIQHLSNDISPRYYTCMSFCGYRYDLFNCSSPRRASLLFKLIETNDATLTVYSATWFPTVSSINGINVRLQWTSTEKSIIIRNEEINKNTMFEFKRGVKNTVRYINLSRCLVWLKALVET